MHWWAKCHKAPLFCCNTVFFNPTIWKPTTTAYQNIVTFDQYSFKSRSNVHVNWVYWFRCNFTYFFNRTNNLDHWKDGSVAVFLSLRVGVKHIQKKVANSFCQRSGSQIYTIQGSYILYKLSCLGQGTPSPAIDDIIYAQPHSTW